MSKLSSKEDHSSQLVSPDVFKNVMGNLPTGVSIVTVREDEVNYGITVSAICSVSNEPPILLVCTHNNAAASKAISKRGSFTVNILNENQSEIALQFAKPNLDKFKDINISYGIFGNPVLNDTLAQLECKVVEEVTGGTHSVFLAEVHKADAVVENPLLHSKGKFGQFKQNK